jgi:hypothetical protein
MSTSPTVTETQEPTAAAYEYLDLAKAIFAAVAAELKASADRSFNDAFEKLDALGNRLDEDSRSMGCANVLLMLDNRRKELTQAMKRQSAIIEKLDPKPEEDEPEEDEGGARIASTNGQVGGFLHTDVAPLLEPGDTVGYLGDLDLSGDQIEENTRGVLEQIVGGELDWTRIALTAAQVEEHDLPRIVKHDRRYRDGGEHEAVETEALSQVVLTEMLRDWLDALLPEPLEDVHEREQRQRRAIERRLRTPSRGGPDA